MLVEFTLSGHLDLISKALEAWLSPMGVTNASFIFDLKFDHQLVKKLSIEGVLQPQEVASSPNIFLAYVSV